MLLEKYLYKQWEVLPDEIRNFLSAEQIAFYANIKRAVIFSEDVITERGPFLSQLFATQDQTVSAKELILRLAGSMGQYADSQEYQAFFQAAKQAGLPIREMEIDSQSKQGILARLERNWYMLGPSHYLEEAGLEVGISVKTLAENFEKIGQEVYYLAQKQPKRVLGIFALDRDLVRDCKKVVKDLQKVGVELVLLTEMKTSVAKGLIGRIGMQLAHCELSTVEKKMIARSLLDTELPTIFIHRPNERLNCPQNALCVDYDLVLLYKIILTSQEIMTRARKLFFWAKI